MGKDMIFKPMSGIQIDSLASVIIKEFQPDALKGKTSFDVELFVDISLEDITDVEPDYSSDLPEGIYGLTDSAKNKMLIQAELAEDIVQEKFFRSTLAHETGHCFLHVPILRQYEKHRIFKQGKPEDERVKLYRRADIPLYKNPEWQAWRFAGALLMPELPLRNLVRKGASLREIAAFFNVNMAFLETRMRALKMTK